MNLQVFTLSYCLLLLLSQSVYSQTRLGTPIHDSTIIATSSKKGTLYVGIDNTLKINFKPEKKVDTLYLATNNGLMLSDSCGLITIPARPGKARINIYGISGTDTLDFGYKYFSVWRVPEPKLTLNKNPLDTPCKLTKNAILNTDSLGIYFSSDIKGSESWVKVTKFSLGYNYGGFYISHLNPSNKISAETKKIIRRIGPDRNITIRATTENTNVLKELPIYRITIIY